MIFRDRTEAGQVLASKLTKYLNQVNTVILALPRGGVPVAYEIGKELGLPVDIFVVRKLGVPGHEELAMGAIAAGVFGILIAMLSINFASIPKPLTLPADGNKKKSKDVNNYIEASGRRLMSETRP